MKKTLILLFLIFVINSAPTYAAVKAPDQKTKSTQGETRDATGKITGKKPTPSQTSQSIKKAAKGSPTWEIQEIDRRMEAYKTGNNLTQEEKDQNAKLKREILNGTFDLRELSRLALDLHWTPLSEEQRREFVQLMTDLLETKAIFSKEQSKTKGKAYVVRYKEDQYSNNKTLAKTITEVYVPKENITVSINYRLKKGKGEDRSWDVFDVIVDGASLVDNYRYQFDQIITKHSYDELVSRMKKKLGEIRQKKA